MTRLPEGAVVGETLLTQILNGLSVASILILIALGLAIIFGLLGVINLAHADLFMAGMYTLVVVQGATGSFWLGVLAAPVVVGAIGLVVEPARSPEQRDGFEWYCFECQGLVHRIELQVKDLVKDLPPLYEAFFSDEKARTCKHCGALHPGRKPPAGWVAL